MTPLDKEVLIRAEARMVRKYGKDWRSSAELLKEFDRYRADIKSRALARMKEKMSDF